MSSADMKSENGPIIIAPQPVPSYGTPDEAIRSAQTHNASSGLLEKMRSSFGKQIIATSFGDDWFEAYLTDDLVLSVTVSDGLKSMIRSKKNEPVCETVPHPQPSSVELELNGHRWSWDRSGIATSLLGKTVRSVFAGINGFYLYFVDGPPIEFMSLINQSSGSPFLYWDHSE